jgi:hypothetical protein
MIDPASEQVHPAASVAGLLSLPLVHGAVGRELSLEEGYGAIVAVS